MTMNIVIIGGVAAGSKAAAKIKRLLPHSSVKIFTDDNYVSYSSCGLPYYIEGNFEDYKTLLVRSVEEFKDSGIDVYLKTKAKKIYPIRKEILVESGGIHEVVPYDKLIIATGARPFVPNIEGYNGFSNIYTLRNIEDGINIRGKMLSSKNITIIGSGYIGLELLEAFVKNNKFVTIIEKNTHIMPTFDSDMSEIIYNNLNAINNDNFKILLDTQVDKFIGNNNQVKSLLLSTGDTIETDMVIICAGVRPNSEIAKNSGIEIGETGAIKVNKLMATSVENIYACGDCAEKTHIVSGKKVWIPLGSTANKEGRCAALNAGGEYCEFEGVLGSAVTRCLNTTMSITGLNEVQAKQIGFTPVSVIVNKYDKVPYMPEASELYLKIIADKVTGLILGGQAVGSIGADKRIYSLTSALLGHMTVEQFSANDFTYSPPYSTTIDPLIDGMQILCKKLGRNC